MADEELAWDERRKQRDERTNVMAVWKEAEAAWLERNRV
jgi:hypothetical protein